jgi:ABC-type antimicrobial peptide transport system permease subunit
LRVAGDPFAVVPSIRAELAALDPDLPVYGIATVNQTVAEKFGDTTAVMTLLSVFAGLAILLAATGVWGVVAHAVTGRRREIGIRLALGAAPGQVVTVTLRQGLGAALAGGVVGVLGAWGASRVLESMLYDVSPTDAATYVGAGVLLVLVSLLAAWFPARRAARIDPVRTLRAE